MNTSIKDLPKYYRSLINALPESVFAIDLNGRVTIWNNAIERMTGLRANRILDRGDYEYALPFYRTRRPVLLDLCLSPKLDMALSYTYIQKDADGVVAETTLEDLGGRQAHLLLQASPLLQGNRVIGAIEIIREIHDRDHVSSGAAPEGFVARKDHYELIERKNIAVRQVLEACGEEKRIAREALASKVQNDLTELLRDLSACVCAQDRKKLAGLEQYTREIKRCLDTGVDAGFSGLYSLSTRETQVAHYIKQGMSNKEIASILNISARSVETHRFRLRKKLGAKRSSKRNLLTLLQNL